MLFFDKKHTANKSVFNSPLLQRTVLVLAIFHLIAMSFYSLPKRLLRTDQDRDLVAYYLVIERVHKNEPVYLTSLMEKGPHEPTYPVYQYPPILSSMLAILPAISFMQFAQVWTILLYIAFWIYAVCLAKIAIGRVTFSGTLVAGLALTIFPGTHAALSLGQVDPLLWALFGIALTAPFVRGAALMAVSLIKPWALWPLIWAFRDGWRVIIGMLIILAASLFLGIFVRGNDVFFAECIIWFKEVLPTLGQGTWSNANWSVSFNVIKFLTWLGLFDYSGGPLPLWARSWLLFCGVIVPIIIGFLLRKKDTVLQLSAVGSSAVILAPICWPTYLPVLLTVLSYFAGKKILPETNHDLGRNDINLKKEHIQ